MAFVQVIFETDTDFPDSELINRLDKSDKGKSQAIRAIAAYINGVAGGQYRAIMRTQVLSTAGTQTITCDQSAATVGSTTLTIAGVTFSVVTTAATSTQITLGAGDTAFATNTASAINANTTVNVVVSATSSTAVVTLTRKMPDSVGVNEAAAGFALGVPSVGAGGGSVDEYDFGHT